MKVPNTRRNRCRRPTFYFWMLMLLALLARIQGFQSTRISNVIPRRMSGTRRMVLTTPEDIIEQASTQTLLDDLIDESVRTSARRPIILQFDPSSTGIWKRWKGTVFSETSGSCVTKMVYACIVLFLLKRFPKIVGYFEGFNILWGQLLSVTTFTLTFFVNQSYALWRKCYELSRRLQGRLHDINMSLCAHAVRKPPSSPTGPSTYANGAKQALDVISRYVRLFNLLTYASFTRSHRPILTPRGMRRLVERGLLTVQEREILVDADVPATQRQHIILMWIIRTFVEAREAGFLLGSDGFEQQWLEKIHVIRSQVGAIGDELQGRMPFAYAHIVQVLIDAVLWMYPVMAVASGMSPLLSVLGTGLLTVSYQGLFDLAKQFLDPYDNESYGKGEDPLVVDTLIAETNLGSVRWVNGLEEMPITAQRVRDGDLKDSILPVGGYTVEELEQFEIDRKKKEAERKARREREAAEKRRKEAEEARLRAASEAMLPALVNVSILEPPILFGNTTIALEGDMGNIPVGNRSLEFGIDACHAVSDTLFNLSTVISDRNPLLVPNGVPMARPYVRVVKQRSGFAEVNGAKPERSTSIEEKTESSRVFTFEDVDNSEDVQANNPNEEAEFDVLEEESEDEGEGYIHDFAFDIENPYQDLPWIDERGPDGQEIRLSQMLADEVWPEELELEEEETNRVRNLAEFRERAEEIIGAAESELLETKEILEVAPGGDSALLPAKEEQPYYDQTKLDAVSQLWGLPPDPDELSEIPGYEEPPIPDGEDDFDAVEQLWGRSVPSSAESRADVADDEESEFDAIAQLWGEPLADLSGSSSQSRQGPNAAKPVTRDIISDPGRPRRLSEILANEEYSEDMESSSEEPEPSSFSYEDYKHFGEKILEAKQDEILETEAILNAPPAADTVNIGSDDDEEKKPKLVNATSFDEFAVLDMDNLDMDTDEDPASPDSADPVEGILEDDALRNQGGNEEEEDRVGSKQENSETTCNVVDSALSADVADDLLQGDPQDDED